MWLVLLAVCLVVVTCETPENVQALLDDVLSDKVYNKMIRGEPDLMRATSVNMNFSLTSINKFDEIGEELEVMGIAHLSWSDYRLTWDPAKYNDTETLQVHQENVWMPMVVLSNPSTGIQLATEPNAIIRYNSNGGADWQIADVFKVKCSPAVTSFPFDRQTCGLVFHVSGYTNREVNLVSHSENINTLYFTQNGLWTLRDTYVRRQEDTQSNFLEYVLVMERKSAFYVINILVPSVLLGFLSVISLMIPHDSGERISYSITVLLSIAVFLNMISDHLPAKSVSMASIYYFLLYQLAASSVTCLCSIISSKMYNCRSKTPPHRLVSMVSSLTCRCACENRSKSVDFESKPDVNDEVMKQKVPSMTSEPEREVEVESNVTWQDVSYLFDCICLVILPAFLLFAISMFSYQVV